VLQSETATDATQPTNAAVAHVHVDSMQAYAYPPQPAGRGRAGGPGARRRQLNAYRS
jgi:hypothetical protein